MNIFFKSTISQTVSLSHLIEARDEGRLAGRDLLRERERLLDL